MVERLELSLTGEEADLAKAREVITALQKPLGYRLNVGEPAPKRTPIIQASSGYNPKNWIILEGNDSYPDLLVEQHRLGCGLEVEQAAKNLDLSLKNTAREQNGHLYIGEIQHQQARDLNIALGCFTLPPRQFVDFLKLLHSGKAFNGNGNRVRKPTLVRILDEITGTRDPWRGEFIGASFPAKDEITYQRINQDKTLTEVTERLDPCLMQDRLPGIDFGYWLTNATPQGFPPEDTPDGNTWFWHPRAGAVAGVDAGSGRFYFYCDWNPRGSNAFLGVRRAKIKAQ